MRHCLLLFALVVGSLSAAGQRVAIIEPSGGDQVEKFADAVRARLTPEFKILHDSLAHAAFRSVNVQDTFNLSTQDARRIGAVIGSDVFILLRSGVQRRASLDREAYFEGFAFAYMVDARTGSLFAWLRETVEGSTETEARERLLSRNETYAARMSNAIKANRFSIKRDPKFLEVPPENSSLAKGLRTPVPYRRLRPEYTDLASNYGVRATIDIEVDVDADGSIARTSIERWAGFGLEESVQKTVRSMNWRPAERDGKTLPMRILLRYNFTKIEKDEAP